MNKSQAKFALKQEVKLMMMHSKGLEVYKSSEEMVSDIKNKLETHFKNAINLIDKMCDWFITNSFNWTQYVFHAIYLRFDIKQSD